MSNDKTYGHPEGLCRSYGCEGEYIVSWSANSGGWFLGVAGCDRGHASVVEEFDFRWKSAYECWKCGVRTAVAEFEGRYCSAACQTADARRRFIDMAYRLLSLQPAERDPAQVRELVNVVVAGWAEHVTGRHGPEVGEMG